MLPHRNTRVDTLIIDSKDRIAASTSSTDFSVALETVSQSVNLLHIRQICVPLLFDNITATTNSYTLGGVASTVPVGQYNIGSLLNYLNDAWTGVYTFVFNDASRVVITRVDTAVFAFLPGTMNALLGFSEASYTLANTYTGEYIPCLYPHKYLTLHSEILTDRGNINVDHTDGRGDVICYIPLNGDLSSNYIFVPDEPLFVPLRKCNVDVYDFAIHDSNDAVLDIHGHSVQIYMDRFNV